MQLNRRHLMATGAAALALGLPRSGQAAGVSDGEILIGTHLDLSGPTAAAMPMLRNAMEMRIAEANDAGGIHGRRLRLIVEDNGSQPQLAVRAAQKLIRSDRVFAFLNPFGSGTNAATVKAATDAGVVVFGPWGASRIIQQVSGASPLLFTTVQNYDTTTARGLTWAVENWGVRRIGVIYQEGPFGDLIRAGVGAAMQETGLSVAAEAAYRVGDIDFSSQVARLRAADCDLVFAGTVIRETVGVMAEVRKLDWAGVRVLTGVPGRSSLVARLGGPAVEGLYGIGGWRLHDPDTAEGEAARFLTEFRDRFGMDADENAANGYSYTSWFIKGLEAAGRDLAADSFAAAVRGVVHEDFTTYVPLQFEDNHAMPELVSIDQVEAGRWMQRVEPF